MPGNLTFLTLAAILFTNTLAFAGSAFQTQSAASSIQEYIGELRRSESTATFDSAFERMLESSRGGILKFSDDEVVTIVTIAREKEFANSILADVYGWAGRMFANGRMEEAVAYFMESAFLYEKQGKKYDQALSCFEIALIQHKAGNYEEAIEYYNLTLTLGGDSLGHRTKISCYNGFSLIEREREAYDSAEIGFRRAYAIAEQNNDIAWMGILSGNIGGIHYRKENYDSSLFYYFRNLRLIKKTREDENEVVAYSSIGKIFLKKKNEKLAFAYLDSALYTIKVRKIIFYDFFNPMDDINETYAYLYSARGDYARAFEYHTKFHKVAAEKQRLLNGRKLKQLQSTYAFRQKQIELDLLRQVNEAHLATIGQQRYAQIAFGVTIVLLGALAFIAYSTGRQRKKLNRELSHSNEELGRLNTIKDKLFSVISHDLRGPLANLKNILTLLDNGHISQQEFHELLQRLNVQLETSGVALEDMLQWAKTQLNEIKVHPEKVILNELTRKVIRHYHQQLAEKNIRCQNQLTPDLIAWADTNQVEIILRNLIGNAIKFTPADGLITIDGQQLTGETLEVTVADTGIGMSDEQLEVLFQPGKHFTNLGTNEEKGTGIGLIITKEMVANNGGQISVKRSMIKGMIFTFTLRAMVVNKH